MQTELKEVQYYKERKEGYRESVQSDIERKEKEEAHTNELLANNTGALAQANIKKYIYFISRDYIK